MLNNFITKKLNTSRYWNQKLIIRTYLNTTEFSLFKKNNFINLITDLKTVLKTVKKQEEVDIKTTFKLLRLYQSDETQWEKFALRDQKKAYTRNLVTKISDIANLLVLVWEPGKSSKIHDHPTSNCFVKVLKGTMYEQLYDNDINQKNLILKRSVKVPTDSVTYITDNIGIHSMINQSKETTVTLHLYVPRFKNCTIYEANGKQYIGRDLGFYSIDGKIIQK